MVNIQWFPGHMTKALRMMEDSIKQVDCVIYVLDARAIDSCMNPKFDKLLQNKPVLYIINKQDLVERQDLQSWQQYFAKNNMDYVIADSISGRQKDIIISKLKELNKKIIEKYANKGAIKSVRAMVVGVPNTGKSTLINSLCKQKRAITGNRPGVTRGKQWVSLAEGVDLLDTPGTLAPAYEDQERAVHLAFIGSIKDDVVSLDDLTIELIKYYRENNPQIFMERYKLQDFSNDNVEVLDNIAKSRGFLLNKNNYDYDRVYKAVLDDFRKQKLGKVMLDFPKD
ncbi:MAG: ribosome biogenesis GTPase YlqF [Clostridiales bacterium]|nr:ribosome biogenesis GTPase YlqF [Clostridiales bacterium]